MSSTNFKILKNCLHCAKMFEAQKITTKYCSHKCNSANYKLNKRLEKRGEVVNVKPEQQIRTNTTAVQIALIKEKEYLTVREVASLLNCSVRSAYRYIESGNLNSLNLGQRITRVKRSEIEKLFEQPKSATILPEQKEFDFSEWYNIIEVQEKYKVSYTGLNSIIKRNKVPKVKKGVYVYVPKVLIDNLLS